MSVNQAIQWLQRDSSTSKFTDAEIVDILHEAKEIIEIAHVALRTDYTRQELSKRAERWLKE